MGRGQEAIITEFMAKTIDWEITSNKALLDNLMQMLSQQLRTAAFPPTCRQAQTRTSSMRTSAAR